MDFARSVGRGRIYTGVPVSGPGLGWPPGAPVHHADAAWVDSARPGDVVPWAEAEEEFAAAIAEHPVALLSPRGYADRTAFGMLIACRELFSRAYPHHQLIGAVALADRLQWMSLCYLSEGIQVRRADGTPLEKYSLRRARRDNERVPPSGEDVLVRRYFEEHLAGIGTLWHEVPVASARLDGLYFPDREGGRSWWPGISLSELRGELWTSDVEVIEAKRQMNTDVIGQVIAGAILLAHDCPHHRVIRQTVVVGPGRDPCLDWVCHKRGIRVVRFDDDAGDSTP